MSTKTTFTHFVGDKAMGLTDVCILPKPGLTDDECPTAIIACFRDGKHTGALVPYPTYVCSNKKLSMDDNQKAWAYIGANQKALLAYVNTIKF